MGYNKDNHKLYYKNSVGSEYWYKNDKNGNTIYFKNTSGSEYWYKYNNENNRIKITEKEYKEIEFRIKEKEYLSREKVSRFELMDI